ncbi:NADPH-dependent FMN reductase [Terrimonas sp.]|uniref:NADPH-dependent FMN reductase n=1 Tax=Terrimonas sp. TaxID=1914338 RepID=UPI000D51A491|nr:NAD(P)H-dependent oxidoreductase [Terrimonas sp.]PVD53892.1 NADPH-dependent FMN reductase [Terrimonas sp.]
MIQLKVITASTRPSRKGPAISHWILELLKQYDAVQVEHLDLKEINLPFLDEPHHPRLRKYTKEHTIQWSKTIDSTDAFIFVTPEYNYGFPATLKNALDYLFEEWAYKPVGIISYGGLSAGTRSAQMLKQVITTLRMMPLTESVAIPFFTKHINEDEKFISDEALDKSANTMIAELIKWTNALKTMRNK